MVIIGDGSTGSSSSHADTELAVDKRQICTEIIEPIDNDNTEASMIIDDANLEPDSSQKTLRSGK